MPVIENGIRQVKERYRAHVCTLPYDLLMQLSEWLARVEFGEYVQEIDPTIAVSNSNEPKTQGAIALCPTGNLAVLVKFFCLATGGIIIRDHWTSLLIPTEVINYMNSLARGHRGKAP